MSTERPTKINQLLTSQPYGIVFQSDWLSSQGYNHDLQKSYRKGKWLRSIGTGAMSRTGDSVSYEGAVFALQKQTHSSVHPGGKTALSLLGKAHYLEMSTKKVTLFGASSERLPKWFIEYDWGVSIDYYPTSFLPARLGITEVGLSTFSIGVSGAARALMECLYLAPGKQDLAECYEVMEGLNNLVPDEVQALLEACRSIKVTRLFLYLAEKAGHQWFQSLDPEKFHLGRGKRSIVKGGVYINKYQITVPKELEESDKSRL